MKRCPQCNRVEAEDALTFCRVDGTPLARESGAVSEGAGTLRFGSAPATGETETRILPTGEAPGRTTGPTTTLDAQRAVGGTWELSKPKSRRGVVIAAAAVLAAALAASAYFYLSRGKATTAINSIAVLPLVNVNADPDAEWLSDGLTESIINDLSQAPNLRVMARSTVFRYKGRDVDPLAAGRELGVRALLTGRVMQRGDSLSVQAELVDASTGAQLWGERYDRKVADALSVQKDISREIADKLRLRLTGEQRERMGKAHTEDAEAYRLYLQGRYHWNKRTGEGDKKAREYFRQAIDRDPGYALAHLGLAESLAVANDWRGAEAAAQRALEIDATLGEAHATLGIIKYAHDWDWPGAERELKRAIELSPNYATARHWYGECLAAQGRFDESLAQYGRALELEPLSLAIGTDLGITYYYARQYDRAVGHLKGLLEVDPNYVRAHRYLTRVYMQMGMFEEAVAEVEKARTLEGESPAEFAKGKALVLGAVRSSGARGFWQTLLGFAREDERRGKRPFPLAMARPLAHLGERDQAIEWLERAYAERVTDLIWLKVDPTWDGLRDEPRFQELVRRVGLPP